MNGALNFTIRGTVHLTRCNSIEVLPPEASEIPPVLKRKIKYIPLKTRPLTTFQTRASLPRYLVLHSPKYHQVDKISGTASIEDEPYRQPRCSNIT
jgi:hypothetical protein